MNLDTNSCFVPSTNPLPSLPSGIVETLMLELKQAAHLDTVSRLLPTELDNVDFAFTSSVPPPFVVAATAHRPVCVSVEPRRPGARPELDWVREAARFRLGRGSLQQLGSLC